MTLCIDANTLKQDLEAAYQEMSKDKKRTIEALHWSKNLIGHVKYRKSDKNSIRIMSEHFKGLFITFEGIEGSGKSTQLKLTEKYLKSKGFPVVCTKEPGGTEIGQKIRQWVLDPAYHFSSPLTELLLFTADRVEHISSLIIPSLRSGKIVLCDRFVDSTLAYQIGGRKVPSSIAQACVGLVKIQPHLTFLFDDEVSVCLARAKSRVQTDRFENESMAFHERVRKAYLKRSLQDPERIKVLSIRGLTTEHVFEKIQEYLKKLSL